MSRSVKDFREASRSWLLRAEIKSSGMTCKKADQNDVQVKKGQRSEETSDKGNRDEPYEVVSELAN